MTIIFDIFIIKFSQNVQNKILFTFLYAWLANCTILEGGNVPPPRPV